MWKEDQQRISDWNDIYQLDYMTCSDENYRKKLNMWKEYYGNIPKSDCQSIAACVHFSLKNGNHAAFAKYYLHRARSTKWLFGVGLSRYIADFEDRQRKNGTSCPDVKWPDFILMKGSSWRMPDIEYDSCKNNDRAAYMGALTLRHWRDGINTPSDSNRDVLVQIGLCLCMNREQVNELMRLAGFKRLYELDIVDAIGIYYLRKFSGDRTTPYHEKLKAVKSSINAHQKEVFAQNPTIQSSDPLNKDIHAVIRDYRKYLENKDRAKNDKKEEDGSKKGITGDTAYLTDYYHHALYFEYGDFTGSETELDTFLAKTLNDEQLQGIYSQRRYGYLKKTVDYLNDPKSYLKNLSYSYMGLTVGDFERNRLYENKQVRYMNEPSDKFARDVLARGTGQKNGITEKRCMSFIQQIWRTRNVLEKEAFVPVDFKNTGRGNRNKVCHLIQGRNDSLRYKGKKIYIPADKKWALMKYAVATGHEEALGQYLKTAGYWEEDLCSLSDAQITTDQYDRLDLLMIYAHKYKEGLLEVWSRKQKDPSLYKSETAGNFPYIKLIMTIARDIQFVNKEIDNGLSIEGDALIFPILSTSGKWAAGSKISVFENPEDDLD